MTVKESGPARSTKERKCWQATDAERQHIVGLVLPEAVQKEIVALQVELEVSSVIINCGCSQSWDFLRTHFTSSFLRSCSTAC